MKYWLLAPLAGLLFLTGCSTTSMKGTPFYTGEYEEREGPAADRVNIWPIVYYRDPALSILWPIMEFSPDHMAVRPVYSVHDRSSDTPVYNVVWPIGRFDTANQDYRIFPVYWGADYGTVFPLYWHKGDPVTGMGYNALFPFWIWNNEPDGSTLHVAWPFYARYDRAELQGWRLWPLYGTKNYPEGYSRYWAWPLGHAYADPEKSEQAFFPLYYSSRTDEQSTFASLLYGRNRTVGPGGLSWDYAVPLWYRGWEDNEFNWAAFPALSWGWTDGPAYDNKYVLGLGRSAEMDGTRQHHVIPFYGYGKAPERTWITSLPYSRSLAAEPEEKSWDLALPLWYRGWEGAAFSWTAIPALSWGEKDGTSYDNKYVLGLARSAESEEARSHHVLPFYYHNRTGDTATFYSLPWWSTRDAEGMGWSATFPFYYDRTSADGNVMVTPLYARKQNPDGSSAWKCFIPLVYLDHSKDEHFMTLLGGHWRTGDESRWIALPLLSGGRADAESGRNTWLAGLAGNRWDATGSSHHVVPFYYSAPEKGTFVSLAYARWQSEDNTANSIIPLLLSGRSVHGDTTTTEIVAGLAAWEKEKDELRKSHVVPLWWWKKDAYLYTALYGRNAGASYHLTPLVGRYAGENSGSWAFPFYRHLNEQGVGSRGSYLLLGKYSSEQDRRSHRFWPLYKYSWYRTHAWEKTADSTYEQTDKVRNESKSLSYLLLGKHAEWWNYDTAIEAASELLSSYGRKKRFWPIFNRGENKYYETDNGASVPSHGSRDSSTLLLAWSRENWQCDETGELVQQRKRGGVFPLLKHNFMEDLSAGKSEQTSSYLGFLYDTRHEQQSGEKAHDYLRRRVLWRLYHHETLNGDKSTDVFPGITVDSYKNGYYKCSVLWRFFRYEKDPGDGSKKLDVLFIPLRR